MAAKKKKPEELDALYAALQDNDHPRVLALGQALLGKARDQLAVVEAMLDAIENLFHEGGVPDEPAMRALEQGLRAEKKRLVEAGAKSDVYARFLDPPQGD